VKSCSCPASNPFWSCITALLVPANCESPVAPVPGCSAIVTGSPPLAGVNVTLGAVNDVVSSDPSPLNEIGCEPATSATPAAAAPAVDESIFQSQVFVPVL